MKRLSSWCEHMRVCVFTDSLNQCKEQLSIKGGSGKNELTSNSELSHRTAENTAVAASDV